MAGLILILAAIFFLIALIFCLPFRMIILHPFRSMFYIVKDLIFYIWHKDWRICKTGQLNCYFAHFGGGKTLSATQFIRKQYKRYNNKKIYDRDQNKYVMQRVLVVSNVEFVGFPFVKLESLAQIVSIASKNKELDRSEGYRTCIFVLIDEASSQLNSREFKSNITPDFLNTLVTTRHYNMSIIYTTQKFKLVDALLRSVTQKAILCKKSWRTVELLYYDADELEYASNPMLVKPLFRKSYWCSDKLFQTYDTLATVDKLRKSMDKGDYLTEQEILALRGSLQSDNDQITQRSRRWKRLVKP